jgi:hypothetical protein
MVASNLNAQHGQAEPAEENERDPGHVDDILADRDEHHIPGVAVGPEDRADGGIDGFQEEGSTHQGHERHRVDHEAVGQLHQPQQAFVEEQNEGARDHAHPQIHPEGGGADTFRPLAVAGPEVVGDDHAGTDADEIEADQRQHDDAVRDAQRRHGTVGDMRHHEGVHRADQDAQALLNEDRPGDRQEGGWLGGGWLAHPALEHSLPTGRGVKLNYGRTVGRSAGRAGLLLACGLADRGRSEPGPTWPGPRCAARRGGNSPGRPTRSN